MTEPKRLKCRFCSYTVLRYRRFKNGKTHHGHAKLQDHVMLHHYDYANGKPGPYGEVLIQEKADWQADPLTIDEE